MYKKGLIVRTVLAAMLMGIISIAPGEETDLCPDEKVACCDLDWTGQGATIVRKEGEVMVSQSPYVYAAVGMRVENGGRVMTLANSTAVVAYDDGCWHVLEENQVLTIEDVSPCCAVPIVPPVAAPAPVLPPWIIPAAAAGAIAGGAILWDDDDDDDEPPPPISR